MKFVILLVAVALVGCVSARPQSTPEVQVLRSTNDINEDGSFSYVLELSDGTLLQQSGRIKNPQEPDPEKRILAVEGQYRYTDAASGQLVDIKYIADENGYQPVGDAIPVAPVA